MGLCWWGRSRSSGTPRLEPLGPIRVAPEEPLWVCASGGRVDTAALQSCRLGAYLWVPGRPLWVCAVGGGAGSGALGGLGAYRKGPSLPLWVCAVGEALGPQHSKVAVLVTNGRGPGVPFDLCWRERDRASSTPGLQTWVLWGGGILTGPYSSVLVGEWSVPEAPGVQHWGISVGYWLTPIGLCCRGRGQDCGTPGVQTCGSIGGAWQTL